ncbi:MAG: zinc ribbon domain-containing protein [Thermoleophilia bacterium]
MSNYCPKCGNKVPSEQMRFCVACGTALKTSGGPPNKPSKPSEANAPEAAVNTVGSLTRQSREQVQEASSAKEEIPKPNPVPVDSSEKQTNWKRVAIPIALAAVLLAVLAGGAFAYMNGSEDDSKTSTGSVAGAEAINSTTKSEAINLSPDEVNTDMQISQQSSSVELLYLKNILVKGDYEKLINANLAFPILVPSEIPSGAKCAAASVGANDYWITFYHTTGCSSLSPEADSVGSVFGQLVGTSQCDLDTRPKNKSASDQEVNVGTNPGLYRMGASGFTLLWCVGGAEYSLDRYYPLDKALAVANNLKAVN